MSVIEFQIQNLWDAYPQEQLAAMSDWTLAANYFADSEIDPLGEHPKMQSLQGEANRRGLDVGNLLDILGWVNERGIVPCQLLNPDGTPYVPIPYDEPDAADD